MRRLLPPTPWRFLARRLLTSFVLLGYLAATVGLPLPTQAHKDSDQPFPCQDNPCGCQSAEQCWQLCCCYTVEEHWAWAEAHRVEPPSYAKRPDTDEWNLKPQRACEEETACACCKEKPKPEAPSSQATRWVIGAAALRCQGAHALWIAGAAVPPPPPMTWVPCLIFAGRLIQSDAFGCQRPSDPLVPPPRGHPI